MRDAARLDPAVRDASDVREVDLTDADAVLEATRGVEALYWVAPTFGAPDPLAAYEHLGQVAASAVRENRIERVVFQSSVGAEARGGFGDIDGLGRVEELLDGTGASVAHLRCGYFFTNLLMDPDSLAEGRLTTTVPLDLRFPWVAPDDIAATAAGRLLSRSWSGRVTQGVYGPEDLSWADVARVLGEVLGRTIEAVQVTDDEVAAGLRAFGMNEKQVDAIIGMSRGLRQPGYLPGDPRDVTSTTPTTLRAWATEALTVAR